MLPLRRPLAASEDPFVIRLRAGDASAFAAVFRTHYMPIVRFVARYVGSVDAAEDIAQDVLLRLWERRGELDPRRSLKAYLFTAARNQALDTLSHDDVRRAHIDRTLQELGPGSEVSSAAAADESVIADELAQLAEAHVAGMSPRLQEIYHLSRVEGLSPAEIAEMLQISVNTVYVQYAKLLRALHPTFERWMRE
jgi:RNA polymerase sigma-70 factor (ECF subfamily)